jgi:hypothetical protein
MASTDLAVRIATILDSTGLNKADKGIKKLEKQAKSLGKTLGIALSTTAVVAFGKASVKAFAEDELAAARLSKAVDNLGLSFANPQIASFIDKLSETSGVVDDQLRPAMQALLTTTGSLAKSQELLNLAVDTSRGSSVELATVSQDLANAYVGNTKGLKKYNLGLTQAELKAASFATIQEKLNKQFSGSSAAYLATYTGKMQLLTTAAGEAKEAIGSGLIDSFKILTADSGITDLTTKIKNLGTYIGDFFRGLAIGFRDLSQMPVIKQLLQLAGLMLKLAGSVAGAFIDPFIKAGAQNRSAALAPSSANSHLASLTADANAKAAAKAEAAAKKRAQDLVKATKTNTAELKKQSLTKKQSALFDLDQIQIIAALKGKISEEDKLRLKLQLALLTENETEAAKLSKQLAMSIDSTGKLAQYLTTLPDAKNPFKGWDEWLKSFKSELGGINMLGLASDSARGNIPPTNVAPVSDPNAVTGFAPGGVTTAGGQVIKVDLNVDGKTLASVLQDASLSGNQVYVDRLTGRFYQ